MLPYDVAHAPQGPTSIDVPGVQTGRPSHMRGVELLGVEVKTSERGEECADQSQYSSRDCPLRSR